MKDIEITLPNGYEVVVYQEENEVYIGLVNDKGYILTDRRLSVSEADKLSTVSHCL